MEQLGRKYQGRERTRMYVRMRDKFTCQECGDVRTPEYAKRNKKRLHDVHHIKGLCGTVSRGYDRISAIPTMITLCHKCHFNRHDWAGHAKLALKGLKNKKRDEEIYRRYFAGESGTKLAKEFGISRQRISQLLLKLHNPLAYF